MNMDSLSEYFKTLESDVKDRYMEKISIIDNVDPYALDKKCLRNDVKSLPQIGYFDIYNYLILKKSAYTQAEFKAYKSLDAFKFFKCGWIKQVVTKSFGENVLVVGQVLHSQRMNEKPLDSWFIAKQEGEIISAHCTCVAGLGETCSHVSALMFYVEDTVRNLEPVTVTEEKCYWLAPSTSKKVKTMASVEEIDFSTAKSKHEIVNLEAIQIPEESKKYDELTDEDMMTFLKKLHDNKTDASILRVTKPFCMESSKNELSFFKDEYLNESLASLIQIGTSLDVSLTQEDCLDIEKRTRGQASNEQWFIYRKGRITASVFKNVCRTSLDTPSVSLIKRICYPQSFKFSSAATKYGCEHEKEALKSYKCTMEKKHKNIKLEKIGLIINEEFPMFGASPDSLVSCDCCDEGIVEVKCPYCAKNISVEELMEFKKMCLKKSNEKIFLDRTHQYFYQVQMQLALSKKNYCDFVVWSKKDIFVERITLSKQFWECESEKAKLFFNNVILPELLGKYFTRT